ncbi:MAG: MFS transporter [Methanocorpusculum sp.]|nr:MFS transporter [Methanocorpusculum sp.]
MRTTTINPKLILFVAAFAALLATFNETYLNVAFPAIMATFSVDLGTVQWLATAYMLGAAVMVPVSAFLYRSIKTKNLFIISLGLLIAGSIICALSVNFPMLLIGRIVQSLGTGMLIPVGMNVTLEVAPIRKLGMYLGIIGSMTAVGPSSSIIIAGGLLSFFSWNVLFWVYGGLALACLICAVFMMKNIAELSSPKMDILSTILISFALIGILYGISSSFGGNIIISVIAAAVGIICLIAFVLRQKKITTPLINLQPLSVRPFAVGVIVNMITLTIIFAMNIIMPLYMQSALGVPAMAASLTLFPAILISGILSPFIGKIYDKRGPRVILPLGFLMMGLFTALLAVFISTGSLIVFALLYIPVICGPALILGPVQSFALSHLKPEMNPHGVVVISTGFQVAGCIGASLFTGVYSLFAVSALELGFIASAMLVVVFAAVGFILALYLGRVSLRGKTKTAVSETGTIKDMGISSVMLKGVYSVSTSASLLDAMNCMIEHKTSGIPVISEDGKAAGFIVDGDIIRFMSGKESDTTTTFPSMYPLWHNRSSLDGKREELAKVNVMNLASTNVISVDIHDDITVLFNILSDSRIKKVPVLDNNKVVGTVSRSDVMRKILMKAA